MELLMRPPLLSRLVLFFVSCVLLGGPEWVVVPVVFLLEIDREEGISSLNVNGYESNSTYGNSY